MAQWQDTKAAAADGSPALVRFDFITYPMTWTLPRCGSDLVAEFGGYSFGCRPHTFTGELASSRCLFSRGGT